MSTPPYAPAGCARDQKTTQYCDEAVAAYRRIKYLETVNAELDVHARRYPADYVEELEQRIDELSVALADILAFKEPAGSHFGVYRAYVRNRARSVITQEESDDRNNDPIRPGP